MTKIKFFLIFFVAVPLLYGQSSLSIGGGSFITIGDGSDISAGSRDGSLRGTGTFNWLPLLLHPTAIDATSITASSFSANWNSLTGATGYSLDVSTDPNFGVGTFITGYQNLDVGNVTTFSVNSNLTAGSTYFYQVRAYDTDCVTESSNAIRVGPMLPVELTSFIGFANGSNVTLNWATATEVNNYGFEVLRDVVKVGFVQGHGNSNSPKSYSFTDKPVGAKTFKYQLKQVDFDGQSKLYGPVEVTIEAPNSFVLYQNFPNPFNPTTKLRFNLPKAAHVHFTFFNILGEVVKTLHMGNKNAGYYEVEFNADNLPSGIYIYQIITDDFIQARKMILLK